MFITWREEWINPYESVWSILEKAKHVNKVNTKQLLSYLGYSSQNKDLINFGLNNDHVTKTFGLCIYSHTQTSLDKITYFLPKHLDKSLFFRTDLYYCYECLKYGLHSLLHQFKVFNYCPFHMSQLRNTCQTCGESISFEPVLNKYERGFTCKCGGTITNVNHFTDWTFNQNIIWDKAKEWISLNSDQKRRVSQIYVTNSKLLDNNNILNMILEMSRGGDSSFKSVLIDTHHMVCINSLRWIKSDYENLHDHIYESIRQTVKSVEKYLIHKVIGKHRECIERVLSNKGKNNATCVHALTFLNWKRSFLNIDLIKREMGPSGKNKLQKFDILVQFFTKEINDLLNFSISYLYKENNQNAAALTWILNHFIATIAITSFFDILQYFKSNIERIKLSKSILTNLPKEVLSIPCVFYYFPKSIKRIEDKIEFYWFKNKTNYAYKNAYCSWMQKG